MISEEKPQDKDLPLELPEERSTEIFLVPWPPQEGSSGLINTVVLSTLDLHENLSSRSSEKVPHSNMIQAFPRNLYRKDGHAHSCLSP
mmetsp:Transcript_7532/g.15480  ORF Transcript_7532/g.15480 Transcript_7532/m.15480 type:complete len:88 (+) Transcript_7532:123-386(+)